MEKSRLAAQMLDAQGDASEPWPETAPAIARRPTPTDAAAPATEPTTAPRLTPIAAPPPPSVERDRVIAAARARLPEIARIARGLDGPATSPAAAVSDAAHDLASLRDALAHARDAEQAATVEAAQTRDALALARHRAADLEAQLAEASERIRELELVTRVTPVSNGHAPDGHATGSNGAASHEPDADGHAHPDLVDGAVRGDRELTLAAVSSSSPTAAEDPAPSSVASLAPEDVFPRWSPRDTAEAASIDEVPTGDPEAASVNLEQVVADAQSTLRTMLANAAAARRGGPSTP